MTGAGLIRGNAVSIPLRDESVDLIITSPPYFALRSYRDDGEHYDGQIGSEPTPQAFLDALWSCMHEAWRVLKPSGVCFVNLGDKRAGSGGHNNSGVGAPSERGPKRYTSCHARGKDGLTPKWTQANAAWLAGVIDCDGCIHVGRPRSDVASARAQLVVEMGDSEVCARAAAITGVGNTRKTSNGTTRWEATGPQARYVLEQVWPWLLIKQKQALAAIEMGRLKEANYGRNIVTPDELTYRAQIAEAIMDWNQRRPNPWVPPPAPYPRLPHYEWTGPRAKSKLLLPHRFAIGCEDGRGDPEGKGWIVRQDLCWSKPNSLPESVVDRPRDSHEYWFMLTKEGRYYSAVDEVREPYGTNTHPGRKDGGLKPSQRGYLEQPDNHGQTGLASMCQDGLGKLPGSVWTIASEPLRVPDWARERLDLPDHFAAFPTEWPRRLILGWSPPGVCVECGEGRRPVADTESRPTRPGMRTKGNDDRNDAGNPLRPEITKWISGYACACPSPTAPTTPAVVLDPFVGTGTVPMVARALGRYGVGIDLSADYLRLARWRVWESGHAAKAINRTNGERQGALL